MGRAGRLRASWNRIERVGFRGNSPRGRGTGGPRAWISTRLPRCRALGSRPPGPRTRGLAVPRARPIASGSFVDGSSPAHPERAGTSSSAFESASPTRDVRRRAGPPGLDTVVRGRTSSVRSALVLDSGLARGSFQRGSAANGSANTRRDTPRRCVVHEPAFHAPRRGDSPAHRLAHLTRLPRGARTPRIPAITTSVRNAACFLRSTHETARWVIPRTLAQLVPTSRLSAPPAREPRPSSRRSSVHAP